MSEETTTFETYAEAKARTIRELKRDIQVCKDRLQDGDLTANDRLLWRDAVSVLQEALDRELALEARMQW